MNKVILAGNITRAPEMRYTPNGIPVCNASIATNEYSKDKETGERKQFTEYHRLELWNKQAEVFAEYGTAGRHVVIEGKLKTRKWETDAGEKQYTTTIQVREFEFTSRGKQSGESDPSAQKAEVDTPPLGDDDIPF